MTSMPLRPQPRFPEPDTEPFWEATRRHELTYQTCDDCEGVIFFPRRHCTACGSDNTTWRVSKGEGEVYTFSVVMQSRHPAFKDLGAYAVAYVDLDEGFRIMTKRRRRRRPRERREVRDAREAALGRPGRGRHIPPHVRAGLIGRPCTAPDQNAK